MKQKVRQLKDDVTEVACTRLSAVSAVLTQTVSWFQLNHRCTRHWWTLAAPEHKHIQTVIMTLSSYQHAQLNISKLMVKIHCWKILIFFGLVCLNQNCKIFDSFQNNPNKVHKYTCLYKNVWINCCFLCLWRGNCTLQFSLCVCCQTKWTQNNLSQISDLNHPYIPHSMPVTCYRVQDT